MIRVLGWPAFRTRQENPYCALLYSSVREAGCDVSEFSVRRLLFSRVDVWHIHWPERYFALRSPWAAVAKSVLLIALVSLARLRGVAIVWTIHNLQPHERRLSRFAVWFWRAFTARVDGAISLSETARALAIAAFPRIAGVPHAVVPLGHFRDAYPAPVARDAARRALDLQNDAIVFLFVGKIRPYKNLEALVCAFEQVRGNVRLIIAGQPAHARTIESVQCAAARDPRVVLIPRHVPAAEIPQLCAAADLAVLPYSDILNSGAALLALSFGTPVLLPDKGSVPELASHFGASWVKTFSGALTADTLRDAAQWVRTTTRPPMAEALDDLNWPDIAASTIAVYAAVLATRGRGYPAYATE